jgi:hypothetical protein
MMACIFSPFWHCAIELFHDLLYHITTLSMYRGSLFTLEVRTYLFPSAARKGQGPTLLPQCFHLPLQPDLFWHYLILVCVECFISHHNSLFYFFFDWVLPMHQRTKIFKGFDFRMCSSYIIRSSISFWCKPSSVCGRCQSVCDRRQGRLCSQRTPACTKFNDSLV